MLENILTPKVSPATRIDWADFAKGFVIILMVLGHVIKFETNLYRFIFVFHMPFFFVMAGFFLNLNKWGGAENFRPFVTKLFRRLLVPYFIAEILWYLIWFVVCREAGYLNFLGSWAEIEPFIALRAIFIGNGNDIGLILGQLWFLPALFFAEIIFVVLWNRLNKFGAEIFVLAVIICSCFDFNIKPSAALLFGIDIALVAQIFLLVGVLIRKYNFVDRINFKIFVGLSAIFFCAFLFNELVIMNFREYGNALLFYAGGISGTLLVMKFSVLAAKVRGKFFALIEDCGRQTMLILVMHPIIANTFYEIIVRAADIPPEKILTEPTIIFFATLFGTLIPLWIAKRFGKLPVLKNFCA